MNQWPRSRRTYMQEFYGNPDVNGDGQPDPKWEAENLVYIKPQYPMWWSWGPEVTKLRVHEKCAQSLERVLRDIGKYVNAVDRNKYSLDQCGGAYNFRHMRGDSLVLSTHAYGAAIDLAPIQNRLGRKYQLNSDMMPQTVVELFKAEGWKWGCLWLRPDAMHFEATSGA